MIVSVSNFAKANNTTATEPRTTRHGDAVTARNKKKDINIARRNSRRVEWDIKLPIRFSCTLDAEL